ncbi:MAG: YqgE/AlgH family protein [Candidatus Magnetomorum sp.]|nr:YqgE/AlgH family protein [Candidatus Magnetomorum sp.]
MITDQKFHSYQGQFLIAMPGLMDPNFHQTVSVICEHNKNGAICIAINRLQPMLTGKNIFEDVKINCIPQVKKIPIFSGGPINPRQVFVLHGPPFHWQGSVRISQRMALTTSLDVMNAIAIGEGPDHYLLALGYSGWGNGQLEAEMMANAWFFAPLDETILFDVPVQLRWEKAGQLIGINPNLICKLQQGSKLC